MSPNKNRKEHPWACMQTLIKRNMTSNLGKRERRSLWQPRKSNKRLRLSNRRSRQLEETLKKFKDAKRSKSRKNI